MSVTLIRILAEISGLVRKRFSRLELTKKGMKLVDSPQNLIKELFTTHVFKFNLGYFDGFPETSAGAIDITYTLYLLDKYGKQERPTSFYADKLIRAFPEILADFEEVKKDKKYKELPPVDTSDLPDLPEGWTWIRLVEITQSISDGDHQPPGQELFCHRRRADEGHLRPDQ